MSNYSYRHGVEQDRVVIYAAFVSTGRGGGDTVCLLLCGPLGPGRFEISTPHSVSASSCQMHWPPCADNRPPPRQERKLLCRLSEPVTLTYSEMLIPIQEIQPLAVYIRGRHGQCESAGDDQNLKVRGQRRSSVAKLAREREAGG